MHRGTYSRSCLPIRQCKSEQESLWEECLVTRAVFMVSWFLKCTNRIIALQNVYWRIALVLQSFYIFVFSLLYVPSICHLLYTVASFTFFYRTIGKLEPSYVIRKFLDAQRIHNLTAYLQALHLQSLANADHTTLLLNCYTKLKDSAHLEEFIKVSKANVFCSVIIIFYLTNHSFKPCSFFRLNV